MIDNLHTKIIRNLEEIEGIRPVWEKLQAQESYPKINADIDRYLSIIKAGTKQMLPYIILIKKNNVTISMLIGFLHKNPVKCNLGRNTIFKPSLRTLSVVYGGLLGNSSVDICKLLIDKLVNLLRCNEADAVNFNHLETHSALYQAARKKPSMFCRSYFPKIENHRYMIIPQDFDRFRHACSHNRRRNIGRWMKKLERQFPNRTRIETYTRESDLDYASKTAAQISTQTYQYAFGGGLVNNKTTQALLHSASKKGWLRIYIFFIENKPCSFITGLKYRRTFFGELTGYIPKWKKFHVGTILFIKVVEDLCKDPEVDYFDFSFGDGQHKQWGESKFWPEASTCIFAPRPVPILINTLLASTNAVSRSIEYTAKKLDLFPLVQKYRRNLVMRKVNKAKYSIGNYSNIILI